MATRFEEFVIMAGGAQVASSFSLPSGTVTNAMVSNTAAIDADKLQHRHQNVYSDERATTIATQRRVIHVGRGTGALVTLHIGLMVAMVGAATGTVGLRKNGSEITSSDLDLDNTVSAYTLVADSGFSNTAVAAGDVFEVEVKTASAGGGTLGTGFFAVLSVDEETS